MKEYKIKTRDEYDKSLPLVKIIEQLKLIAEQKNKAVYIRFDRAPSGFLPHEFEQIIQNLPKECRGIDLGSLIHIDSVLTMTDFENLCQILPKNLIKLNAERILRGRPSPELIERFLKALPAAEEISLKGNALHHMDSQSSFSFKDWEKIDLRANSWHLLWRESNFLFLKKISRNTTSLYFDLPTNDQVNFKPMCEAFFKNLPPHIHTLGLSIYKIEPVLSELAQAFSPSVRTIKWFNHKQLPHTNFFSATPQEVNTLDLSNWSLGFCQHYVVGELFKRLPGHVHILDLSNNDLNRWSLEDLRYTLSIIPETVTQIYLQGNALFNNKTPSEVFSFLEKSLVSRSVNLKDNSLFSKRTLSEREQLLEKIGPLLTNSRFVFDEDLVTPVIPLTQAIKQALISKDAAHRVIFYLGAQTQTFFHDQGKKFKSLSQSSCKSMRPET